MIGLEDMGYFDSRIESLVQRAYEMNPSYGPLAIRNSMDQEITRLRDPDSVANRTYRQTGRFPESAVRTRLNLALMVDDFNLIPGVGVYLQ